PGLGLRRGGVRGTARTAHGTSTIFHEGRLWRRVYPPTGREGLPPVTFVFADTTAANVDNTVAVLEQAGRRYGAPRQYDTYHRGITARDYGQAVPALVTTVEQLQGHGADAAVWRRLGREGEQTLTATLDNPDGDALYRRQAAQADEEERRRVAEREARPPTCARCGTKFTDQRQVYWSRALLTAAGLDHAEDPRCGGAV
ncbi:hypothetical protein AB0J12_14310, partial [Streptomyces sp. NPDC049915]